MQDVQSEATSNPSSGTRTTSLAIRKAKLVLANKRSTKLPADIFMNPDLAKETLKEADFKRMMLRTAAQYVSNKCREDDERREKEIRDRGDDKEIEKWLNGARYHNQEVLWEARDLIEDKYLKTI